MKCDLCRQPKPTNKKMLCDDCANAIQRLVLIKELERLEEARLEADERAIALARRAQARRWPL